MIKNHIKVLILIFFGFFLSVFFSINNLNKYDKNLIDANGNNYHQMIKYDTYLYLSHGSEIKNDLKNGKNFFETGREHYTKYLPARIAALYYYILDVNLFENENTKKINTNIHFYYLIIQSLIYFLCLIFFYLLTKEIFEKRIIYFIIAFFCFEPTLFQYHGTFWSETYFFSFQILLAGLILSKNQTIVKFLSIGLVLGLMSLQKQPGIFYIIPVSIFLIFYEKRRIFIKLVFLLIGFALILSILGFNNLQRSEKFYLISGDAKMEIHNKLVRKVMTKKLNISREKFDLIEGEYAKNWLKQKNIKYDASSNLLKSKKTWKNYRNSIYKEKDKIKFDDYIRNRSLDYLLDYPLEFIYAVINGSFHTLLLNPLHIYSDHKFRSGEIYYGSEDHKKFIPYRMAYTLIIYLLCLLGVINLINKKEYYLLSFIILSYLYFYVTISWHGNTRYYLPSFVYLGFLFTYGVDYFLKKLR
ncbi:glycosyltransferase family 39 protein [Candidatus Pelagibacter sp. RS39]|uniref:glycosyltransferase family 39 protein n=1 Tax=Candidatus Pelagibacter sp. RS39 TaxID=1977864 RepID=UPI000A15A602|nr:glycosyltransferase family 39 protein [Candidatus Pelagibacter sp. RS39]ARJ48206.1 hypothetical protein B5L73_05325 [Candidatus Pelagibacter sp. RS39]